MRRREFITLLGGAADWPVTVRAQQPDRVRRLGILIGGTEADYAATNRQLLDGLAQLRWTETQNLRIDYRLPESNNPAVICPHAKALVRAAPDVIFVSPGLMAEVLQRLTRTGVDLPANGTEADIKLVRTKNSTSQLSNAEWLMAAE